MCWYDFCKRNSVYIHTYEPLYAHLWFVGATTCMRSKLAWWNASMVIINKWVNRNSALTTCTSGELIWNKVCIAPDIFVGFSGFQCCCCHVTWCGGLWWHGLAMTILGLCGRLVPDIQYIPRNMHTVFALLWLSIDWFSHIHQAYFTGTVAI